MKFFIDTASLDEIRSAAELGVLDGVTTNPSLIAKIVGDPSNFTYNDFKAHIRRICEIVDGPVSAEVTCLKAEEMMAEGEDLASIHENVVVKCPLTIDGLKAIRHFSASGIRTNATLVFSPNQALLAAKAGADYVSPFVGRLDDISTDGMGLVEQIVTIYENYGFMTEVIVASVRHPQHVVTAAMMGADIATIPYSVIKQLANHPLTDAGLKKFMDDAAVMKK
ncbi:MAG: fructose-6-phosphate aldolase [Chlorobium sp.]|uniref:fructose-6-phosphate aldolase n=1 Tax=Chlorobium sp. TaxID=1095 RepID=UPI0025C47A1D|nr:fructose-6-phosphate aldolase [Chlorobium sp.]MCF8217123.1 fructose-6-phosphate aldolase [Chlorobium sp.]MCF8271969.1 fructose-6-phosphate aldolase [Chlorobium sp.]MCF8288340.1 fructose-6-phosphate aldolase [Chlorobium sp.]MCF8291915.1 fructose-6-phosphate aldolase [Chlorobium sp.]MCF8386022.1 fructose-6-phosphate aldolase [Chlorobium sp.]